MEQIFFGDFKNKLPRIKIHPSNLYFNTISTKNEKNFFPKKKLSKKLFFDKN
jgi:hypothetical protein